MQVCVLNVLTKEQREAGFSLRENGDHFIHLYHKDFPKPVATFTQTIRLQDLLQAVDSLKEKYA